jgi:hypothetical protein
VKELEGKLAQFEPLIARWEVKLYRMQTPAVIKARLEEKQIEMDEPLSEDIVRVKLADDHHPREVQRRLQPDDVVLLSVTQ